MTTIFLILAIIALLASLATLALLYLLIRAAVDDETRQKYDQ